MAEPEVVEIEVIEDFTARGRCDEGFLHVRRLRCRNLRSDGSRSEVYRVDVVDRPKLDAVAVLIHRQTPQGIEILTRENLRPAAYFRKDKDPNVPDGRSHLRVEELVAGVMEAEDRGWEGVLRRAAEEVREEAGLHVLPEEVEPLGGPIFMVPGIVSEKIFLTAVDVTGKVMATPEGDGSPLEEGSALRWRGLQEALAACRTGEIQDAKTEVALCRFADLRSLPSRPR